MELHSYPQGGHGFERREIVSTSYSEPWDGSKNTPNRGDMSADDLHSPERSASYATSDFFFSLSAGRSKVQKRLIRERVLA